MASRLAILLHHREIRELSEHHHLISYMVDVWQGMGLDIVVFRGIPSAPCRFDVLLPHIDLTVIPPEYQLFCARFPMVLNRKLHDISKRNISQNLVDKHADYDGPVIVKTDANYGGFPEYNNRRVIEKVADRIYSFFKPAHIRKIHPSKYPVYEEKSLVPVAVWKNKRLVVERFMAEREGEYYCNRICFFFGHVVLNYKIYSKSAVIKSGDIEIMEPVKAPQELLVAREELGLDYGKFDYVMNDGKVQILDANTTLGGAKSIELNTMMAEKLAVGISKYLSLAKS